MGEIKSTIDLVMEKTQGLKLTEEDKKALEEEKQTRGANAAVMRYLKGDLSLEDFVQTVESSSETFERAVLRSLVESLQLGTPGFSRAFNGLKRKVGSEAKRPLQQLQDLSLQFAKSMQKHKKKVKEEIWTELARQGVKGSAVEPNLDASPQWQEMIRVVEREFASRLEKIKEDFLSKLGVGE